MKAPGPHRARHATETAPLGLAQTMRLLLGTVGLADGAGADGRAEPPSAPRTRPGDAPPVGVPADPARGGLLPPVLGRGAVQIRLRAADPGAAPPSPAAVPEHEPRHARAASRTGQSRPGAVRDAAPAPHAVRPATAREVAAREVAARKVAAPGARTLPGSDAPNARRPEGDAPDAVADPRAAGFGTFGTAARAAPLNERAPAGAPEPVDGPEPAGGAGAAGGPEPAGADAEAAAWHLAASRARVAAADLAAAFGVHADVRAVVAEGDAVVLNARFSDLRAWRAHCSLLGVRPESVTRHADACVGAGEQGGIAIRLVGHGVPMLLDAMAALMREPYLLWGQVYDLAAVHRDSCGNLWEYRGAQSAEGVPLLALLDRPAQCRITDLVREIGPLEPLRGEVPADGVAGRWPEPPFTGG